MYILFFGGFIFFLDYINFIMDVNKKSKTKRKTEEKTHRNLILRYIHACDKRSIFIRINHYFCIFGILLSIFIQLISLFHLANVIFSEIGILFLICFFVYLVGYRLANSLLHNYKESKNLIVESVFFLTFLFIVLSLVGIEVYMLFQYFKFK